MKTPLVVITASASIIFLIFFLADTEEQHANFTDQYKRIHQGKAVVLVPEVHELANIIIAISKIGQEDRNMVRADTPYYREVLDHFLPFKNHAVMRTINAHLTEVFGQSTYNYYYNFRMNACAYRFKGNKIVNGKIYERMSFGDEDRFKEIIPDIEAFAIQSGFRKFYKDHSAYYQELVAGYHELCPIGQMWKWIEREFPQRYQGYKVIFSPLIGGAHSTRRFVDNGYAETVMFISGPIFRNQEKFTVEEKEAILARVVLTEIDHNYVNPTTELYANEINTAMQDVDCWNTKVQRYETPMATFNEYMTWAVFTLYLYDNFAADVFKKRNDAEAEFMASERGFKKFREFNSKLLEFYKNRKQEETIYDLHKPMIDWVRQQSCK